MGGNVDSRAQRSSFPLISLSPLCANRLVYFKDFSYTIIDIIDITDELKLINILGYIITDLSDNLY